MIQLLKTGYEYAKHYVLLGVLVLASGLLVALKLKDNEIHQLQVQNMQDTFKAQRDRENEKVRQAKEFYESLKGNK